MIKGRIIRRLAVIILAMVLGFCSAVGIMNTFATASSTFLSFATSGDVVLDGSSAEQVTVSLTAAQAGKLYTAKGHFATTEADDANGYFSVAGLTYTDLIEGHDHDSVPATGQYYYKYSAAGDGVEFAAGDHLYEIVYDVNSATPAGTYHLPIIVEYAQKTGIDDFEEDTEIDAIVTVTRNDTPVEKPSQVVTFRDENGEVIGAGGISKFYADEDFVVTKEVTTGDGAIIDYHPDDAGGNGVAHTVQDSDLVGIDGVGDIDICAWVAGTDNYAETKSCYTVHVSKRPLDIIGVTIEDKVFDETTSAVVTSVSFDDRGLNSDEYTATATFSSQDAGSEVGLDVTVTLIGTGAEHYILNSNTFSTYKPIMPFALTMENIELMGGPTYTYNPGGVEPEVRVKANGYTLGQDDDYMVSYLNNTAVGTGFIVITGKKNYTTGNSSIVLEFTIGPETIINDNVNVPDSITAGNTLAPEDVSVNVNGHDLTRCESDGGSNCDYVLALSGDNDGIAGHTIHVEVSGRNNYTGVGVKDVEIVAKTLQNVSFGDITDTIVDATYGDTNITHVATTDGGGTITYRSTDESVATVTNNGVVTIVGVGYTDIIATAAETETHAEGSARYTINVAKRPVSVTNVSVANKTFDGSPIATINSVSLDENSLTYNVDYTATGLFNGVGVAIREVNVMVALTDDMFENYCFMSESNCLRNTSYSATASILPFALSPDNTTANLTDDSFVYTGEEHRPGATVAVDLDGNSTFETDLVEGTDYELAYENNVNAGVSTATAKITGKGNYTGSWPDIHFTIGAAEVENVVVTALAQDYTGSALEPVPVVSGDVSGTRLTFNPDDFEIAGHEPFINAGDHTFSVTSVAGGNYYIPSTEGTFTINRIASDQPAELTQEFRIEAGKTLAELGERSEGFAWEDATTVVAAGSNQYRATYTQNGDTTNYETADILLSVYGLKRINLLSVAMNGGVVTGPGATALEGDEISFVITPDDGNEVKLVMVNSEDKTSGLSNGRLTMTAGAEDITVIAYFRRVYEVTSGAWQEYVLGSEDAAEFEIDASYDLFEDDGVVYVDGEEVDPENYDSRDGSTIISLKPGYLGTLAAGEHLLAVEFSDDGIARAVFTIASPIAPGEASEETPAEETPGTADTGKFTGIVGGVAATGTSMVAFVILLGAVCVALKNRK